MKPESEDSSSSSSSDSEFSDEEKVPSKGKMKELLPPPPLKKRDSSQSPHHSWDKSSKSLSRSRLQSERMINGVNFNLQEEMIDTDINHDQGAVHTPGLRDPHHY